MQIMPPARQWDLFKLCLQITHNQTVPAHDWASAAKDMAEKIAGSLGYAIGELPEGGGAMGAAEGAGDAPLSNAPVLGAGSPQAAVAGGPPPSPFGAAFTGWDTESLRMILIGAQQVAIGRIAGAPEEQINGAMAEMMQGLDQLTKRRQGA